MFVTFIYHNFPLIGSVSFLALPGIAFPPEHSFPNIFLQFFTDLSKVSKLSRAYVVIAVYSLNGHSHVITLHYHSVLSLYRGKMPLAVLYIE